MSRLKLSATEKELQRHVETLLVQAGWRFHHEVDSRKSNPGWPDLVAVRIMHRYLPSGRPNWPWVLFLELKTERGTLRPEQLEVWADLTDVGEEGSGEVQFHIVRPSMLDDIEDMITRGFLPEGVKL